MACSGATPRRQYPRSLMEYMVMANGNAETDKNVMNDVGNNPATPRPEKSRIGLARLVFHVLGQKRPLRMTPKESFWNQYLDEELWHCDLNH